MCIAYEFVLHLML